MSIDNIFLDILYLILSALGDLPYWIGGSLVLLAFVDGLLEAIKILKG